MGEATEPVAVLAEPEEHDLKNLQSNVSTEHTEDVERNRLRDPKVEWLEPPVGPNGEAPPVDAPAAKRLRNGCHTSWRFAWCQVHTRLATCNKKHVVRSDSPVVCLFFYVQETGDGG